MNTTLIEKLNIDKADWTPVKFGDVVFEPKETSRDPAADGIEHVVGLEHIESGTIHLKESAGIEESTTFTKRFSKGDVLFGRRRAYLRKAAQASFDGICSGDITVFRAKENLLPELLPFLVSNEKFFEYAIKHSAGGLSPRVKFKDLANYEFLLPPKDQQAQLAELLWAMDEVIEREKEVLEKTYVLQKSTVNEFCLKNIRGAIYKLDKIINHLEAGVSVNSEEGQIDLDSFGILKTSCVSEGYFISDEVKKVVNSEIDRLKAPVRKDTIIISRMNTAELVGANVYIEKAYPNLFLPDRLWQTQISNEKVSVKYLWYILSSPTYRTKISDLCTGTSNSMKNISKKSFLNLEVNLPSKHEQDKIVHKIDVVQNTVANLTRKIAACRSLQKSLINQIF